RSSDVPRVDHHIVLKGFDKKNLVVEYLFIFVIAFDKKVIHLTRFSRYYFPQAGYFKGFLRRLQESFKCDGFHKVIDNIQRIALHGVVGVGGRQYNKGWIAQRFQKFDTRRSEEHTSELQ